MSLRVLGLDLSYAATGMAATHDLDGPRLHVRTINPGARRGDERIDWLVGEICEELRWLPDVAVIEGLFVANVNNSLQLAELHGCVKRELYRHDVPYVLVAPSTLKVYASGNGKADKAEVLHAIRARYADALGGPSQIQTNDEADAQTLLAMGLHSYGQPLAPVPLRNAAALKSVRWPTLTGSASPVPVAFADIAKPDGALL